MTFSATRSVHCPEFASGSSGACSLVGAWRCPVLPRSPTKFSLRGLMAVDTVRIPF